MIYSPACVGRLSGYFQRDNLMMSGLQIKARNTERIIKILCVFG